MSAQPQNVTTAPEGADAASALAIPAIIAQAQEAFRRDLPRLLKERPGQWVAYQGESPIHFGKTKTAVYQACLRQGHARDTFVVRLIQPELGDCDFIGSFDLG